MIDVLEKPIISKNFTVDDIHKIREYNYELTKNMTNKELINYYNEKANEAVREMNLV